MTQLSEISGSTALPNSTATLHQRLAAINYQKLSELKPYSRSLRRHPEKQLVKLAASIREFGFNNPILIDDDETIIAGHARLEAARRAGLTEVPTIRVAHLSKAEVKAFRLAEQRLGELASWDRDALVLEIEEIIAVDEVEIELLGWETAELDIVLDTPRDTNTADPADELFDPPNVATTRLGDLWLLGNHRLLCGSSLSHDVWERLMDGAQAAMSFCDPPFNLPIAGHVSGLGKVRHREFAMASGEMSEEEFIAFLASSLSRATERLKNGAILAVCMDWKHLFELQSAARAVGLSLLNICVWNKTNGGMGSLYRSKHELVLILKTGLAPHRNNVELGRHGRYRTNVWDYAGANSFGRNRDQDLADHPTVKPVALVADAIRDVSARGEIVIDPFIGSGTTILAAERTGRLGYGIEIDPTYMDVAIRRWEEMTGKQAILGHTGETFSDVAAKRAAAAPGPGQRDSSEAA